MEIVPNRLGLDFFKKYEYEKLVKQQSQLSFDGIHKSYENEININSIRKKIFLYIPIYSGFVVLELSKLWKYETHYDKLR